MDDIQRVKQMLGGYNHDPEHADLHQALSRVIADSERYRYLRDNHTRKWVSKLPQNKNAQSIDLDFSGEGHDLDAALDRSIRR